MEDKVGKQGSESKAVFTKKAVLRQESDLSGDDNVSPTGKRLFLIFPVTEISIHMQSKQLYFFYS